MGSLLWIHGKRTSLRAFTVLLLIHFRSGLWEKRPVVRRSSTCTAFVEAYILD